ncbi:MAG: hypothetical protein ACYCYO_03905 [Bacilli bacterium]
MRNVTIFVNRVWVWSGYLREFDGFVCIADCIAYLPDGVYDALDRLIQAEGRRTDEWTGSVECDGHEYTLIVEAL